MEINTQRKKNFLKKQSTVNIWDHFKWPKIHIFEASKGWGIFEEIMAPKFPNLMERICSEIQQAQQNRNKVGGGILKAAQGVGVGEDKL